MSISFRNDGEESNLVVYMRVPSHWPIVLYCLLCPCMSLFGALRRFGRVIVA